MNHLTHWAWALVLWCCSGVSVAMAAPSNEETQLCVAASTRGQTDRDEGRLLAAREQLLSCAREACPAIVRKSCAHWLSELAGRIPSVVVRVQEARQRDVTDARVTLDGLPVNLDGRPLALDPGTHVLTVEAEDGPVVERTFLIGEREQGRLLVVELPAAQTPAARVEPAQALPPTAAAAVASPIAARAQPESFSVPAMGWVLGGLGVVGIATFTVLRIELGRQLRELERTCSPTCSDAQRDNGKHTALIADISLGVGIAALAGGVAWTLGSWLAFEHKQSAVAFALVPISGGAFASFVARY